MILTCKCCGEVICKFETAALIANWNARALRAEDENQALLVRVRQLELHIQRCESRDGWGERAEKAEAKLKVAVEVLTTWLAAYDATGPDNGPSLTEHECAEQARAALAKLRGEP